MLYSDIPRARGGVPQSGGVWFGEVESPLRMRGFSREAALAKMQANVFPAHAGVFCFPPLLRG